MCFGLRSGACGAGGPHQRAGLFHSAQSGHPAEVGAMSITPTMVLAPTIGNPLLHFHCCVDFFPSYILGSNCTLTSVSAELLAPQCSTGS